MVVWRESRGFLDIENYCYCQVLCMHRPLQFPLVILSALVAGCGATRPTQPAQPPIPGLESPDQLTVYSLDPSSRKADSDVEKLREWRVLGKVEVKDPQERKEIAAAIQAAVTHPDGTQNKCFDPRHAVVVVEKGQTLEIIICFSCRNYSLNGKGYIPTIGRQPKEKLNAILWKAGVKLASEPGTP
jgi:hypothetical protein